MKGTTFANWKDRNAALIIRAKHLLSQVMEPGAMIEVTKSNVKRLEKEYMPQEAKSEPQTAAKVKKVPEATEQEKTPQETQEQQLARILEEIESEIEEAQMHQLDEIATSEDTTGKGYAVVWPEHLMSVQREGDRYTITSSNHPETFPLPLAQEISETVRNGKGQQPQPMKVTTFYRQLVRYLRETKKQLTEQAE